MRLVIFDLDGTLVDSIENITNSVNFVREKINKRSPVSKEAVINYLNNDSKIKAIELFGANSDNLDREREAFREYYLKHCIDNIDFYPGMRETLDILQSNGIRITIATNGSSIFAKRIIEYLNVTELFQAIFGADNSNSKPNPDMLLKSMEICSCPNSETIMVGDSIKDMLASNSAECRGLFASWGYGRESLSHSIIETPKDILRFLINNI